MAGGTGTGIVVIYDGQCPFCAAYTRMLRLRAAVGEVRLVDARGDAPEAVAARAEGLDLDRGMVVRYGGATYHGDAAMHLLAVLSGGPGVVNRLTAAVFRSPGRARLLYPALAAGRGLTLRLLGRRPIGEG